MAGKGGYRYLAEKYGVPVHSNVEKWVNAYKAFGDKGLIRSKRKEYYSLQFKLFVVKLYLEGDASYQELALSQGINNPAMIVRWVNAFRAGGSDALNPKRKGSEDTVKADKRNGSARKSQQASVDAHAEHLKELKAENLKLRIENAYLKELRRLCLGVVKSCSIQT